MNTLILSPRFTSDTQALWQAVVKRDDWTTHRAYHYQVPSDLENPVVFGEMQFCDIVASRVPQMSLLEPPEFFLDTLCSAHPELTHRNIEAYYHKDLHKIQERKFIKPANDKVFVAGVYERGQDVPRRHIDPMCPVLVSDVVEFETEYRCYVLDGQVLTLSCYEWPGMLHQENPDHTAEAQAFATKVLAECADYLPSAVVLDVGQLVDGRWAVIEANQAYASGIYHEADTNAVLDVLARASGTNVSERDQKFIRVV